MELSERRALVAESMRQESVRRYGLTREALPGEPDREIQRLVVESQRVLDSDFAAVHIFDGADQVRIAASPGLPLEVADRSMSLCQVILERNPNGGTFVVADASTDRELAENPWVNGDLGSVRFYAAAQLISRKGQALGVLCAWSTASATPSRSDLERFEGVRDLVMRRLEQRRRSIAADVVPRPPDDAERADDAAQVRALHLDGPHAAINAVIDTAAIRTLFQPIVHLATGSVVGFEALSRGPAGSELESPTALLAAAKDAGRLGELDWLCRVRAMQAAARSGLHRSLSWFINVEPAGLSVSCPEHLLPAHTQARSALRVILEVVERDVQGHVTDLLHTTDQARADAWGVALDDVGADDASLALLPFLQPDVVKLDMSLVRSPPDDRGAAVTASVRAYAERTGAVILAEGIETEEHEHLARVLGATYGQGYRYGHPGPLPGAVPAPRSVVPLHQRPDPSAGMTAFDILSAHVPPQRAAKRHLLHISRHIEEMAHREDEACVLLAGFQEARFFTDKIRKRYAALAEGNALTVVLASDLPSHTEPRFYVGPVQPDSRLPHEWTVIVVGPHQAVAFVARDCQDAGPDDRRRFDFVYTYDRDLVASAGRAFLRELPIAGRTLAGGRRDRLLTFPATLPA